MSEPRFMFVVDRKGFPLIVNLTQVNYIEQVDDQDTIRIVFRDGEATRFTQDIRKINKAIIEAFHGPQASSEAAEESGEAGQVSARDHAASQDVV